jgi:hypothetical protein
MARSGDAKPRKATPAERLSLGRQRAKLEKANKVKPQTKEEKAKEAERDK